MKTKMQHVYLHVHATISTKDKDQTTGPVPKPPIQKVQINKNHYRKRILYLIRHVPNPGFPRFKYDTLIWIRLSKQ